MSGDLRGGDRTLEFAGRDVELLNVVPVGSGQEPPLRIFEHSKEDVSIEAGTLGNFVQAVPAVDPVQGAEGAEPKNSALVHVDRSDDAAGDVLPLLGERLNLGI